MRKRAWRFAAGSALLPLVVLAAACGSDEPERDEEPVVQLVYQDWRTDWFPPMVQEMLKEFHATHPKIRVLYIPDPDDVEDSMLKEMKAGTAADVFQGCCTFFPIWAQQGYTLDLAPMSKPTWTRL